MQLVNIGYGNMVAGARIVAIISPDSAPVKRLISEAKDRGDLIDATYGKRTKSVIITDCNYIILSSLPQKSLGQRVEEEKE